MKKLIIVRHSKSDWGFEGLSDIDRPLNQRGYRDAYDMSNWYGENNDKPDAIYTSSATRALSTAFIFARLLEIKQERFYIIPEIYESTMATLKKIISMIPDNLHTVLLFGHNPGLTNLANELCIDLEFDNIPTTGMVALQFETASWKNLTLNPGKLTFYKYPKEFKN